jgi:predicted aspartyl protease
MGLTRTFALRGALLLLWFADTSAAAGADTPETAAQATATPSTDSTLVSPSEPLFATPTRLDRIGRIMAPVYINGIGPFRLVVDTGASHTSISPELAQKLGLVPSDTHRIVLNGVTGFAEVPVVTLDTIRAGELLIRNVQAPVIFSSVMAGAEGILGVAGLRRERIYVDFRHDRIEITRSTGTPNLKAESRDDRKLDLRKYFKVSGQLVEGGLLAVDVRIGGVAARAIIDTGAERTLGNGALRDALRRRHKLKNTRATEVYGTTEAVSPGELELAPPMLFGGAEISDVTVVYGDFHIFKLWKLEERPAVLIGMDVLGTVGALVIDFRRRELYLQTRGGGR